MNKKNTENIILEEYENEFSFKKKKSDLKIDFNRIAFIFFIFFSISVIYSIQLLHLGSLKLEYKETKPPINKKNYRADIIDRNGDYLVKSVSSINIGINPVDVIDKKRLLINLKWIFPNKNYFEIKKKLNKNKFFNFEKKISPENYEKIMALGDKSIRPEEKLIRLYPQENLFSHIIGQIDDDNNGISGLEKSFDNKLKETRSPLQLTVDIDIQFLIREELIKYQKIFRASGSAAILMDVNNGNVISMVSLPDFNLNERKSITDINYINRVTKGTYELGSVFKTFTFAAGLNEGVIETDTMFLDLPKSIPCAGFPIREYDKDMPSDISAEQILIRSGNIGSVRIAQSVEKLGKNRFKLFLEKIGVLSQIEFDIEEVATQKEFFFGKCKLATAAFGHGITTTILQLAKGYAVIANGGFNIKPKLIKENIGSTEKGERLLKKGISERVMPILRKIVSTEEGTANQANVEGFNVAGKTGTAQKPIKGQYSNVKVNTFASIFPSTKPKFVFIVMLEAPKTNSEYVYEYRNKPGKTQTGTPYNTAGWTSVEVAGKIIEKIGPILATKFIEN